MSPLVEQINPALVTGELPEKLQSTQTAELHSQRLLSLDRVTIEDVFPLLQFLPSEHQRFSGDFSWASGAYVHGGIVGLRHNLVQYPLTSKIFAKLISSTFPELEFTSFVVLYNTLTPVHQDLNNQSGFPNALIPFSKFKDGGLWLEGPGSDPCPDPSLPDARGTVVPLHEPILFDAHQRHATCPWVGDRCVLAAFVINDFRKLDAESINLLTQAAFKLLRCLQVRLCPCQGPSQLVFQSCLSSLREPLESLHLCAASVLKVLRALIIAELMEPLVLCSSVTFQQSVGKVLPFSG